MNLFYSIKTDGFSFDDYEVIKVDYCISKLRKQNLNEI